jgi:hypothetical protein
MRTYPISPGTPIEVACVVVHDKVSLTGEPHSFEFNGVTTEVHEGMSVDDIMEKAFQGKLKLERYRNAKFEQDLRAAIRDSMPPNPSFILLEQEINRVVGAIRPFLRTP